MYEELVKRLRDISNSDSNIKSNYIGLTMIQAADVIEELQTNLDAALNLMKSQNEYIKKLKAEQGTGRGGRVMPFNVQCKKCLHYRNEWCAKKLDSPDPEMVRDCLYYSAATNADRIRAMTDEELADFMIGVAQRGGKPTNSGLVRWLDWLKQEATD